MSQNTPSGNLLERCQQGLLNLKEFLDNPAGSQVDDKLMSFNTQFEDLLLDESDVQMQEPQNQKKYEHLLNQALEHIAQFMDLYERYSGGDIDFNHLVSEMNFKPTPQGPNNQNSNIHQTQQQNQQQQFQQTDHQNDNNSQFEEKKVDSQPASTIKQNKSLDISQEANKPQQFQKQPSQVSQNNENQSQIQHNRPQQELIEQKRSSQINQDNEDLSQIQHNQPQRQLIEQKQPSQVNQDNEGLSQIQHNQRMREQQQTINQINEGKSTIQGHQQYKDFSDDSKFIPAEEETIQPAIFKLYNKPTKTSPRVNNSQVIQAQKSNHETCQKTISELRGIIQRLEAQQNRQFEKQNSNSSKQAQQEDIVNKLKTEISDLNNQLQILKEQNSLLERQNIALEGQLMEKYQSSRSFFNESQVGSQKNIKASVKQQELQKQFNDLKEKYDKLDSDNAQKQFQIDDLNLIVEDLRSQLASKQSPFKVTPIGVTRSTHPKIFDSSQHYTSQPAQKIVKDSSPLFSPLRSYNRPPFLKQIIIPEAQDDLISEPSYRNPYLDPQQQEYLSQMIFPYKSPIDYYNSQQKTYRGQIVPKNSKCLFKDIENLSNRNQLLLKRSCFEWRSQFYEGSGLSIFQQTQQVMHENRTYLSITINIRNTEANPMRLQINQNQHTFSKGDVYLWVNPEMKQEIVAPRGNIQYEFMITTKDLYIPEVELNITVNYRSFQLYLPSTLFKHLMLLQITQNEFKQRWKKDQMLRSTEITIGDQSITRRFLKSFIMLNDHKQSDIDMGICDIKYGAAYLLSNIEQETVLLVKVYRKPTNELIIQISYEENKDSDYDPLLISASNIIQEICFLLS